MNNLQPVNELKDESNPKAVINMVPGVMQQGLKAIPDYVFEMSLEDLKTQAAAGEVENKLRIAFWLEYERAHRTNSLIQANNLYRGICNGSYFFKYICTNSFKLAYIFTPPQDYRLQMEELLHLAMGAEREILSTPIKQTRTVIKDGKEKTFDYIDASLAQVQHKIRESLQARLQGMPVHRSMQITENRNFSANVSASQMPSGLGFSEEDLGKMSTSELSKLVTQLKEQNSGRPGQDDHGIGAEIIDVEAKK